jgi:hypothetical protein
MPIKPAQPAQPAQTSMACTFLDGRVDAQLAQPARVETLMKWAPGRVGRLGRIKIADHDDALDGFQ